MKTDDIVETLTVRVKTSTKALFPTHKKNMAYDKDETSVLGWRKQLILVSVRLRRG